MQPSMTPQQFVEKWRQVAVKERSGYQTHFNDLCALVGHDDPITADPAGTWFTFEAGANKQKGGQGWADVWKKGHFALEYKGKHANLEKAYQQLLQYRESLENPPLLVVCDMDVIEVHSNFTNTVKQVYRLSLDDLLTPAGQKILRNLFFEPEAFRAPQTTAQVTEKAATEFAKLAEQLRKWGEDPHRIAHFLIRLLFCLFAEDIGLLPKDLLTRLIEKTRAKPSAFQQQLTQLFEAMAHGGWFGTEEIAHFNGRLFNNAEVLELDSDALSILERVSRLDWSAIEPAILGILFERSLDEKKRAQLGAHYTSRDDILLIVEPVLMQPLRRRWGEVQTQARDLAAQHDQLKDKSQRTKLQKQLQELLLQFQAEIAATTVLDPACGSGNFLYVALKQLLDLEKEVITFAGDIGLTRPYPQVSPEQLHGIEINEYAYELAQITCWIGFIQWLRDNGFGRPSEPILKPLDTIRNMDAILAFDEQGRSIEPKWPVADVVIGNPPFLGMRRLGSSGMSFDYMRSLQSLYKNRVPGDADLVCYWFERSRSLLSKRLISRVGLLATNSIRGGSNRVVLDKIKETGDIFMAWSDRSWILDGADVRVSMVGFDCGFERNKELDGYPVSSINPDLTSSLDLTIAKRLSDNLDLTFLGINKGGPFDINDENASKLLKYYGNPNGKPNNDVVKRIFNGIDVLRRPRNMWIIDFNGMELNEASEYVEPFEHIIAHVKPVRDRNREPRTRAHYWLFRRSGDDMREAIKNLHRYIVTVLVSKHRIFQYIDSSILPDGALCVIAREDDYFFGVLHSRPHELWSLRMCTWLGIGNDPRYTPTTTFETFPFPWTPGQEPQGNPKVETIAQAAHELVEKRDRWLNPDGASEAELKKRTLTNLYNERPTWLDLAHKKLDKAVLDAYGWPHDISNEEILARLLALNLERAAAQGALAPIQEDSSDDDGTD